jgi:histidinol dehydrogenase
MKTYKFLPQSEWQKVLQRPQVSQVNLDEVVKSIFEDVQKQGQKALSTYVKRFQGFEHSQFMVTEDELKAAEKEIQESLKAAINQAYQNIHLFHASQLEKVQKIETMPGVNCWRKSVGIEKVGLYIPGGTAPLFSTVLMLGIPAKLAGCKEIVLCSPCDSFGKIHPAILYAAQLVGVQKIYKVGGIQAIAALTLGTTEIPAVYKIFGPGNQYVTAAKQYAQKFKVAIDMPAGPSEVMVVADESAVPSFVAADLLSQAEHGVDSQVVLVTNSESLIQNVESELSKQLVDLPRQSIASEALENALILLVDAVDFENVINVYAPEHLIIATENASNLAEKVVNAGSVFIGNYTPESAGDYASGTNHTLPTDGYARQYSGVSVDSFVRKITFQQISEEGIKNLGPTVKLMAEAEELFAHKNAVTLRLKSLEK